LAVTDDQLLQEQRALCAMYLREREGITSGIITLTCKFHNGTMEKIVLGREQTIQAKNVGEGRRPECLRQ